MLLFYALMIGAVAASPLVHHVTKHGTKPTRSTSPVPLAVMECSDTGLCCKLDSICCPEGKCCTNTLLFMEIVAMQIKCPDLEWLAK